VSALAKWLAAQDSFYAQPAAPGRAVFFDRLFGVLRAARRKPAMLPQHRTQEQLVHAYHGEKNLFHNLGLNDLSAKAGCGQKMLAVSCQLIYKTAP
jgi:hypothetical protein